MDSPPKQSQESVSHKPPEVDESVRSVLRASAEVGAQIYKAYSAELLSGIERARPRGDRIASDVLLGFAVVLTLAAFAFKIDLVGIHLGTLASEEFIAVLVLAGVLLLTGTFLRALTFDRDRVVSEGQQALAKTAADQTTAVAAAYARRAGESSGTREDASQSHG